jgi:hypothetical protein
VPRKGKREIGRAGKYPNEAKDWRWNRIGHGIQDGCRIHISGSGVSRQLARALPNSD